MADIQRKPILIDYLVGGVLTSGLAWFWLQLVNYVPEPLSSFVYIPMFVMLCGISSYIVCKKTSIDHIRIGIRTALSSWLFSVLFLMIFAFDFDLKLLIILLTCYVFGGLVGAYTVLRKLPKPEEKTSEFKHQEEV